MGSLRKALIHSDWGACEKQRFGHTDAAGCPHRGKSEEVAKQAALRKPERAPGGNLPTP